jgi:hypothetical protein
VTAQAALRTARLRLVPLAQEHLEAEVELDADPEVMRFLTGRASTRAEVEARHRERLAVAARVPGLGFWAGLLGDEFVGWWWKDPLLPAPRKLAAGPGRGPGCSAGTGGGGWPARGRASCSGTGSPTSACGGCSPRRWP